MWVLDYLVDLESDFSRFHRVDDIYSMEGPRFFQMAYRMSWYGGVMAHRVEDHQNDHQQYQAAPKKSQGTQKPARSRQDNVVDLTAFMFSNPGLVEKHRAKRDRGDSNG